MVIFDFVRDPLSDLKYKEIKRSTLNELIEYMTTHKGIISETIYPMVVQMVSLDDDDVDDDNFVIVVHL